mgnify:CR=1 FL=1
MAIHNEGIMRLIPSYRILGDATASGVSQGRNPKERQERYEIIWWREKMADEMPLYPR